MVQADYLWSTLLRQPLPPASTSGDTRHVRFPAATYVIGWFVGVGCWVDDPNPHARILAACSVREFPVAVDGAPAWATVRAVVADARGASQVTRRRCIAVVAHWLAVVVTVAPVAVG